MHHIYHTKGIVLESREKGEANKFLSIFTREHGMIFAAVQGIRHNKSKLRYALSDFSYSNVDLVRGRDIWRVTTASPISNFGNLALDGNFGKVFANLSRLVLRLYQGEESNEELFDHIIETFGLLKEKKVKEEDLKHFEIVAVFRILYYLGYLALTTENDVFVKSPLDESLFVEAAKSRTRVLNEINKSLRESQL